MMKTGSADLPLHPGRAPPWLFKRMVKLAHEVTNVILYEYSQEEFLKKISNPFWFQAFGCALGFDWHSSGLTTTTCGALKLALAPEEHGIAGAGGKGKKSKNTLQEIEKISEEFSLTDTKIKELTYASRMSAKVDSSCVQDGYELYHHSFFFTEEGKWSVVQQGMNISHEQTRDRFGCNGSFARRYHWLSGIGGFVSEPHSAICCDRNEKNVLNLTSKENCEIKKASVDLLNDGPDHLRKYFSRGQTTLNNYLHFSLPARHPILSCDMNERDFEILKNAYELQPENYEQLVSLRGMGAKKLRALALVSDLMFGIEAHWNDPVKYSFAHGGKDGFPYPVDRETYDSSISELRQAIESAKLGNEEKYRAIRKLNQFLR